MNKRSGSDPPKKFDLFLIANDAYYPIFMKENI